MAREGSETAAQREGSLWRAKPVGVADLLQQAGRQIKPKVARPSKSVVE